MSKLPDPWKDLTGIIKQILSRLSSLEGRSPFFQSGMEITDPEQIIQSGSITIPDTGLLLVDGGDVVMLDEAPSATELFRLGAQEHGDRGLTINRVDGSVAIEVRDIFGVGKQSVLLYERTGRIIAGDSILSGSGFDAPHIPITWDQVNLTAAVTRAQTTTSGTFVPLFEHRGYRQNPALDLQVYVWCSDGTTSAEVQVYDPDAAVYLGGFLGTPGIVTASVPTGTTTATMFTLDGLALPAFMSDDMRLEIHARRTAGAGTVSVGVARSIGRGF